MYNNVELAGAADDSSDVQFLEISIVDERRAGVAQHLLDKVLDG